MARKRMISPEFWTDEKLGECSRDERLLFMGLISNADDEGRGRANVKLIKSAVFPYDDLKDETIEQWISALIRKSLVYVYVLDGQQFYYLPGFEKHQTINKPSESKLPSLPEEITLPEYYRSATGELPPKRKEEKRIEKKIKEEKGTMPDLSILDKYGFTENIKSKLAEWFKYKAERKDSYQPTGLVAFLSGFNNKHKLYKEPDVLALIDECMGNNWKGIIWDRIKGKEQAAPTGRGKNLSQVV